MAFYMLSKIHKKQSILFEILLYWLLLVQTVLIFRGALIIGPTLDEPVHLERFNERLTWGLFPITPPQSLIYNSQQIDFFVHGLLPQYLNHAINVVFNLESPSKISYNLQAFQLRHAVTAILGIGIAILSGKTTFLLTRNKISSLITSNLVLVFPLISGHAMMNPKDIHVVFGYTLFSYALIKSFCENKYKFSKIRYSNTIMIIVGIVFCISTRFAMYAVIFITILLIIPLLNRNKLKFSRVMACFVSAVIVTLLIHPFMLKQVLRLPILTLVDSSNFHQGSNRNFYYIQYNFLVESPHGVILIFALAIYIFLLRIKSNTLIENFQYIAPMMFIISLFLSSKTYLLISFLILVIYLRSKVILIVVLQATLVPIATMLLESNLYTGTRQLLFIYPAICILILYFVSKISLKIIRHHKYITSLIILSIIEVSTIFPYNYTYKNLSIIVANDIRNARYILNYQTPFNLKYSTDYWGTSVREMSSLIPKGDIAVSFHPIFKIWNGTEYLPDKSGIPYWDGYDVSGIKLDQSEIYWSIWYCALNEEWCGVKPSKETNESIEEIFFPPFANCDENVDYILEKKLLFKRFIIGQIGSCG